MVIFHSFYGEYSYTKWYLYQRTYSSQASPKVSRKNVYPVYGKSPGVSHVMIQCGAALDLYIYVYNNNDIYDIYVIIVIIMIYIYIYIYLGVSENRENP